MKVGTLPVPSEVSAPFGVRHIVLWHVVDQRVRVRPFHEVGRVDRIEEGTWTGAMYPTRDDAVQGGCPTKDVKSGPGREVGISKPGDVYTWRFFRSDGIVRIFHPFSVNQKAHSVSPVHS